MMTETPIQKEVELAYQAKSEEVDLAWWHQILKTPGAGKSKKAGQHYTIRTKQTQKELREIKKGAGL